MFKVSSVYQVYQFERTCICPSAGIVMLHTLKGKCKFKVLYPYTITADFSMQNTFKAGNMHQNMILWIYMGKSMQGVDLNIQLLKWAA